MLSTARLLVLVPLLLCLTACFKTELGGSVAGSTVNITDLRTGAVVQDDLTSLSLEAFIASRSQEEWDNHTDLGKLVSLGNFFVDKDNFIPANWYLVTVSGGWDLDPDGDGVVDTPFAPVAGTWHALMKGAQLRSIGLYISPLTEALYRYVRDDIPLLDDTQLEMRLNSATQAVLGDVNNNGSVGYGDALNWSTLFHRDKYLLDFETMRDLADALRAGEDDNTVERLALAVLNVAMPDAQQFYNDNISMPIVQSKCVNCHTSGGIAPARGARLVVVTNSNPNHLTINHQAFITLGDQLGSRDLSDYVTAKASGRITHGGGTQVRPGSVDLRNLETYLNLIE